MRTLHRLAALLVLAAVVACPTPVLAGSSLGTVHAKARVLYSARWQHGLSGWSASGGTWSTLNGTLVSMGATRSTILAPFQVSTSAYTISAQIHMIKFRGTGNYVRSSFGILFRAAPAKSSAGRASGLGAGNFDYQEPGGRHGVLAMVTNPNDPALDPARDNYKQVQPPGGWQTFTLRVDGNQIRYSINGHTVVKSTQSGRRSNTRIGLFSYVTEMQVRNFKVTSG